MASEVDIANLSLSYLGDSATVSSINPPDGSAQAGYCNRFYPVARDALLEMSPWGFATKRQALAQLSVTVPSEWRYAYAVPEDMVNVLGVLDPAAVDDYSQGVVLSNPAISTMPPAIGAYTPQPFSIETIGEADVLLTNQQDAVLRYTARVTDTTKFTPLFIVGLAKLLASMLAGPLLKGETGIQVGQAQAKEFALWFKEATESDVNQRRTTVQQRTPWMANRA